ncbi:uncharacterized protein LOC125198376 isoform X2 [Salvia hispanica]|uniref:uncharacterized protein LOC125198376 isoform X2 n=1 Tax=Salvia hispanica TaxID=49212 RepID=UPI002009027E|nr:uncharacterized protein LOC125198376 isoform X2 [Salvia hispanica]
MASSLSFPQSSSAVNVASFVSVKLQCDRKHDYEAWREQMLCLLESQGLVGFIDGKVPPPQNSNVVAWRRTDWLVKGWILGTLSNEVIESVNSHSARTVWLKLECMFSESGRASIPPAPAPPPRPSVAVAYRGSGWYEYMALYRAAMKGEWDEAKEFLDEKPGAVKVRMGFQLETPLHVAVAAGKSESFVSNLLNLMSGNYSLAFTDGLGYNPLHIAAMTGNHHAAEILVTRHPMLLCLLSRNNNLPHHLAAEFGHRKILLLLISKTNTLSIDPFSGDGALRLLVLMIDAHFFDIAENFFVSKHWSNPMSIGTTLKRIAVNVTAFCVGDQLSFWKRPLYWCIFIMDMKQQSFDSKIQMLETPTWRKLVIKLHSALCQSIKYFAPGINRFLEKNLMREEALRLVKLCNHVESLNYEEALAIFEDIMLTAAESGNPDVVEEIVKTFPHAIHCVNSSNQTCLHLAIKNSCERVFNLMYQTSNYGYHYSNKIDDSGNSILHLVARLAPPHKLNLVSGAALQMQREIQWFQEAAITVPGSNQSESGYPMFYKSVAFKIFAVSDAVSLFTSTTSLLMFLSILTSRYAEQDFLYALPKRLSIGLFTLFFSILFMIRGGHTLTEGRAEALIQFFFFFFFYFQIFQNFKKLC